MNKLIIIMSALILSGCAISGPPVSFNKPGAGPRQTEKDHMECAVQARAIAGYHVDIDIARYYRDRCMYGRGYDIMCGGKKCQE